jgi:DNA invertase Pin-like site-specific DNA recombinase
VGTETAKRAVNYERLSDDKKKSGDNVADQREGAKKLAAREGFDLIEHYRDNSRTASDPEKKPRPEFLRLLEDAKAGRFDVLIVRHIDRLYRHPADLWQLTSIFNERGIVIYQEQADYPYDLRTPTGMLNANVAAAVALYEIQHKKERQRAMSEALLKEGKPLPGGPRPFGFDKDKEGNLTIREDEAALIRAATKHVREGGSLGSVIRSWNEQGIPAARGGEWGYTSMRALLMRWSNAGIRQTTVEVVDPVTGKKRKEVREAGPGTWEPIVSEHDFRELREKLLKEDRIKHRGETGRKHLLSHILKCGKCGSPMRGGDSPTRAGKSHMVYQCPGVKTKCRLAVDYAAAEDVVIEAVTKALAMPDPRLLEATADEREAATAMRRRLTEIGEDEQIVENGGASLASKQRQLAALNTEREQIEERLAKLSRRMTLSAMLTDLAPVRPVRGRNSLTDIAAQRAEVAKEVRKRFEALDDLDRQRQVIRSLVSLSVQPADRSIRPTYETARKRVIVTLLDPATGEPYVEDEAV